MVVASRAAIEENILGLFEWLGLWRFCYRQWGGYMIFVSTSSLCILDVLLLLDIHNIYVHIQYIIICVMFARHDYEWMCTNANHV